MSVFSNDKTNMRLVLRTGLVLTALLFWQCCGAVQAAENCHTPEPQVLIGWYHSHYPHQPLRYSAKNSLIYHPIEVFQTSQPHINWIGLAWLSPEWGALFAANCEGQPLAAVSVGAIGKIMAGPVVPVLGQTVMFIYVARETRECVHDSADIVALKDGKIISLWSHAYKQGMNIGTKDHPRTAFVTHNYTVRFGDTGRSIHVSGLVQKYPYYKDGTQSSTPSATRALPEEHYHWDAKRLQFVAEHDYPQTAPCTPISLLHDP